MKQILIFLSLLVWSINILASDTSILFRHVKYSNLFNLARKENKGVMLYFHFDGCGACVEMEKTTLKDENVMGFLNSNFINFKINTRKGEGIEINKLYKVKLHPTFIFFDSSGNEIHRLVGLLNSHEFLNRANNFFFSSKNLRNYKLRYSLGDRNPDFLFEYSYMLRDGNELDSLIINEYLNTQNDSELSKEKNLRYIYEFAIHQGKTSIPYNSRIFYFMLTNRLLFSKYFELEQINTRLMFIILSETYKSIDKKDSISFYEALQALKEFDIGTEYNYKELDGRITRWTTTKELSLSAKVYYYNKIGDTNNYILNLNQYVKKVWNDADELNNIAWSINEEANTNETKKIETAIKCSIRSIELKNNYAFNDTYAWLLYKSGQFTHAIEQAKNAIEIAKKNNEEYQETIKLIDIINRKVNK